ncbi:MAG TPA: hypothetical protein VIL37_09760 [Natronosporangium sp.]
MVLAVVLGGCASPQPPSTAPTPWAWEMPDCVVYQPADYPAQAHRSSVSVHAGVVVSEQVEQYEPGWGSRAIEDVWSVVRECASYESESFLEQHQVLASDFAGDESLLVETVRLMPPETQTRYAAVVRYGDQVVTVWGSELGPAAIQCLVAEPDATCPASQA